MKKFLFSAVAALLAFGASADIKDEVRIYINPGHGAWCGECRHMGTVTHGDADYTDTCGFYESNTNMQKGFGMLDKLIEYGIKYDKTKGARDLTQNLVISRVRSGDVHNGLYDRPLTEIAAEAELNNFDMFISIHSNANDEGSTTNFPIYLYRGTDAAEGNAGSIAMAKASWPHWIKNPHMMWTHYTTTTNIRGDVTYMGSSLTTTHTNGKSYTGYYGVLRQGVPGFLVEGYFHTYQPARHKAMNWDACRWEGAAYAKGVNDYFGIGYTENYGTIYGVLRDGEQTFTHTYYTPNTATLDKYLPINDATVTLKNSAGEVVDTYKTDDEYNGVFVFNKVPAGTYSLTYSHPNYKDFTQSVTVTANETTFPTPLFETEKIPVQGHYAYGLSSSKSGDVYTLNFKSTGAVDNGSIIFTNTSTGATQSVKVGAIKKGDNSVTVNATTLGENATFSWSVAIDNPVSTGVELISSDNSIFYNNGSNDARIGVAIDKDQTSANFGTIYTITAMGQGLQKFNPDYSKNGGKLITGMFGQDRSSSTSTNKYYRSNRLEVNGGKVYIANYAGSDYTGIWVYDPSTGATPTNVSGTTYYERGVAFYGEGSNRKAFSTHENNLQRFDIGTGSTWTSGSPAKSYTTAGVLDNGDGDIIVTDNAVIAAQCRYSGNNLATNPAFAVFDHNLNLITKSDGLTTLNGSENGGMAITSDYKTFAIANSYSSSGNAGIRIQVYSVIWNGSTPTFTHQYEIPLDGTYRVDQMEFDHANNLVIASQQKGLLVYTIKNPARQTVTKATTTIQGQALPAVPGRYAYNLSMTQNESDYTLTFTSTGDVESASVVLTPTNGGETKTVQINGVKAGENTVTIDANTLEGDVNYNWAIAINNPASPSVELMHSDNSIVYNNGTNDARIGLAIDNDETSANFGTIYTLTAIGQGLQKYNPDFSKNGSKLITGLFGQDLSTSTSSYKYYRSNRLEVEDGKIYIANYGSMNPGVWVYDPATGTNPTCLSGGTYYERAVAFYGEGSSRKAFTAHENNVQRFDIGTGTTWTSGSPSDSYTTAGVLDNGDGDILVTDNAVIAAQNRYAGNNLSENPAFAVFDHDLNLKYKSDAINATLNGSENGGMAITSDYKTFAIADSYTNSGKSGVSVQVYDVTWSGATPTFTHKFAIPLDGTYRVDQMEFDYAGNLVIASQQKGLLVYAIKTDARTTTTNAAATSLIKGVAATPVTNLKATRQCYGEGSNTAVGTIDVEITWTGQENNRENLNNYKVYYQTMRRDAENNRIYDNGGEWVLAGTATIDFEAGETGSFTHKNIAYGSDDNGNYDRIYNYKVVPYNANTDSEGAEAILEGKGNTVTAFYPSTPIDVTLSQPYMEKDINNDGENEKLYTIGLKLDIAHNDNLLRIDDNDATPAVNSYVIVTDEATANALNAASNASEVGTFTEGPVTIVSNNCNHSEINGWYLTVNSDIQSLTWNDVNPSLTYKPQVYLASTRAFNFTACETDAIEFTLPAAIWSQGDGNNIIPVEGEDIASLAGNEDMPIGSFRKVGDIETATDPVEINNANVIGTNGAVLNPLAVSDDVLESWNITYTFELKDSVGNIIITQSTTPADQIYSNTDSITVDVLGLKVGFDESVAPDGRTRYTYNAEKNQTYKLVVRTTYSRDFNGEEVVLTNESESDIIVNPTFPNPVIDPYNSPGYLFIETSSHPDAENNTPYTYHADAVLNIAWEDFNDNLVRYMGYHATPDFTCAGHDEDETRALIQYYAASLVTDAQIAGYNERINTHNVDATKLSAIGYNGTENWSSLITNANIIPMKVHYVWAGNEKVTVTNDAKFAWELSANYPVIESNAPMLVINAKPETGVYNLTAIEGSDMRVITTLNESYKNLVMDGIIDASGTGIENITIGNSNVEYYNLQGVKVENPQNGIYIKVNAGKASRVYVK